MDTRDELALLALNYGFTISRNIANSTDTYEKPHRTVIVGFDQAHDVISVTSEPALWWAQNREGVMRAINPNG